MSVLTSTVARFAATAVALAGTAVVSSAPAHAAAGEPAFAWKISTQYGHLSDRTYSGGATADADSVVTFPNGVGSYDAATGAAVMNYAGSVKAAFSMVGTEYYHVTIAEPAVSVEPDGSGEITAVVSSSNIEYGGLPAESTTPTRVVVSTFAAGSWSDVNGVPTLTATPDWQGVLPAGSPEAQELGIPEDQPIDGQAFQPAFLKQITSGVRAHFYASGGSGDPNKPPAPFTAQASAEQVRATPSMRVRTVSTSPSSGVQVEASGTGFTAVTNPGDAGVYVGVAKAGGLPDVDEQEDADNFVAAAWVTPSQMPDGSFVTQLSIPANKLVAGTKYSVYTWQAHTHSNTTQDTETALPIDWAKLKVASTVTLTVPKKPRPTRTGKLVTKVAAPAGYAKPTGQVKVQLLRGGKVVKRFGAKRLVSGKVVLTLPKMKKTGKVTVKSRYLGSPTVKPGVKTTSFRVTR